MATFTATPGLDNIVARMVADDVREIARKVEFAAKRLAPPGKKWVSMSDNLVRHTHRAAHRLDMLPANLRFAVPAMQWDVDHDLSGGIDYLLEPRDTSTGLPLDSVQHVHCRCKLGFDPTHLSRRIRTGPAIVNGPLVTVEVTCTAAHVLAAEYGEVYPGGWTAEGTHFMSRAAAAVGAAS